MKFLTPGTTTTADLDHILRNNEERGGGKGGPLRVFRVIRDNFTQTSERIIKTKQTYLSNSPGAHVNCIFNSTDNHVSLLQRAELEHGVAIFTHTSARMMGCGAVV